MDIPRTLDRPWTPPELEDKADYFNIYGTSPPRYPIATEQRWLKEAIRVPDQPAWVTDSFGLNTPATGPRPKPSSRLTEPAPYTPTRPCYDDSSHLRTQGEPRYPYTPDSSRILRRNNTELPASPTPWDDDSETSSSPVQNALSSCIAHFENLIQTHHPDEEQMEYIVGQFEAMTAHLSSPSGSQTEATHDDKPFSDSSQELAIITQAEGEQQQLEAKTLHHEAYVSQVGNYIAGVQKYIYDLKTRMDEFKTLNRIQTDIINDLRKQMRSVRQSMREELDKSYHHDDLAKSVWSDFGAKSEALQSDESVHDDNNNDTAKELGMLDSCMTLVEEEDLSREIHEEYSKLLRDTVDTLITEEPSSPKRKVITIIRSPPRRSFWGSMGEALDAVSNLLLEE
ncbi:hypothetical protein J4E89_010850 [Alternaria sp. Ai002NY15]|nr:hypothetical protein J4E89_010850 [Alternaria sp. Ai002NY15]